MKRLLLWLSNLVFLMFVSAATALPATTSLEALGATEVATVTAGNCATCSDPYPYVEHEGWDLIGQRQSAHTYLTRHSVREYVNPSRSTTAHYSFTYNDGCKRVWTGGSVSLGRSIGISFNTTYHCSSASTLSFSIPPLGKVRLYDGQKRYYITYTYRHYLHWSDGYREFSGLTDTVRAEYTYYYREIE